MCIRDSPMSTGSHEPRAMPIIADVAVGEIATAIEPPMTRPMPLPMYIAASHDHRDVPWAMPDCAPMTVNGMRVAPHNTTGQYESRRNIGLRNRLDAATMSPTLMATISVTRVVTLMISSA